MCSKRCKHTLKDRIPLCAMERRCCEQPIPPAPPPTVVCMLQKEEQLVDCNKCRPKSGSDEHACVCNEVAGGEATDQNGSQHANQLEGMNSPPAIMEYSQQNGSPTEGSLIKTFRENGSNRFGSIKKGGSIIYDQSSPTSIRHMDEWEAMAVMLATNGRIWGGEDIGFARQYKAALSAVNTKFEEEAANMTGTTTTY